MNIRIGDIVRFLTEKLEGKVTGIIDINTVNVFCDEYGFEIPASVNDLVVIRSDFNTASTPASKQPAQKSITIESADTLYLAIVPENFNNLPESRYEIYLVNDTALTALYSATYSDGNKYSGVSAGNCNPDQVCLIGSHAIREIENIKAIRIQAIFYQKGTFTVKDPIDIPVRLSQASLCKAGAYKHARWFESVCILRPLSKETILKEEIDINQLLKASQEKETEETAEKRPQKQVVNNVVEIDLHISQLVETTAGMENKDMLEYQLEVFHKTLEEYKLRRGQKIIFIHGKGDGVLKQRILWELQTKYKRFHHQDASFKQYGYGATMVTIK